MSAVAADSAMNRTARFYQATIGKKVVMAVTGIILLGFVFAHMLGNLQIYLGRDVLNAYALKLREVPALLWGARIVLIVATVLHVWTTIQLARIRKTARPVAYVKKDNVVSSYASRTMLLSGPTILAFVIYHLMHFTWGTAHPQFKELMPYDNVVSGFSNPLVSGVYIVAMILLGMHIYHGAFSMFQSLGVNHPKYTPKFRQFAAAFAAVIVIGNISIPVSVLLGLVPKP